jgi:glycosyltransferase involved in cell wall biosynthesis
VRCQGRNTLPGVRLNCRGAAAEAVTYGAALALWQRRLVAQADAIAVPSTFAAQRLQALNAPLGEVYVVPHVLRTFAETSRAASGEHVLVASRLAPEKGVDVAIQACRQAGLPLVVAGDGPLAPTLHAAGGARFVGRVSATELADLRARAALALVPSRAAETYGLAAAEAMAAGVPVVASKAGALTDLVDALVQPGDADALAAAAQKHFGDEQAGAAGLARIRELASPEAVAAAVRKLY